MKKLMIVLMLFALSACTTAYGGSIYRDANNNIQNMPRWAQYKEPGPKIIQNGEDKMIFCAAAACMYGLVTSTSHMITDDGYETSYAHMDNLTVVVQESPGGMVGEYIVIADTVRQLREMHNIRISFKFDGNISSASALFRQMLKDRGIPTCHTKEAIFGYHMLYNKLTDKYSIPYDYLPMEIINLVKIAGKWRKHDMPTVKFDYKTLDRLYDRCEP